MNKISLILLFSILVYPSTCIRKYKCADKLKINTCYLSMETGIYVKGCAKNEKCTNVELNDDSHLNQCVKVKEFRKNGDSCVVNEECQSSYCANGKCAYIPDGKNCEYSRSCNKNSRCKRNYEQDIETCKALSNKNEQCDSSYDCAFGLLCNKAMIPSQCVEMFSLENGKPSDKNFLCASGSQYNGKCATIKVVNSNCTFVEHSYEKTCQVTYNTGEGDLPGKVDCLTGYSEEICPPQHDSKEMKNYIEVYKQEREKITQKDIEKIHVGNMNSEDEEEHRYINVDNKRYTLNGNKKVVEAFINLVYSKNIEDYECVMDYFISNSKGNKIDFSINIVGSLFLFIFL